MYPTTTTTTSPVTFDSQQYSEYYSYLQQCYPDYYTGSYTSENPWAANLSLWTSFSSPASSSVYDFSSYFGSPASSVSAVSTVSTPQTPEVAVPKTQKGTTETVNRVCTNCGATQTTRWRNVRTNIQCTACFSYERKYNKPRPTVAIKAYKARKDSEKVTRMVPY